MSANGRLTATQLATLKAEIQNDPRALGLATLLTTSDWPSIALCLDFVRDGITACPSLGNPPVGPTNVVGGPSGTITAVTNTANPQVTSAGHGLAVGDSVLIAGVLGATGANGTFKVASVVGANDFTVADATAPGVYTSGGTFQWCVSGVRVALIKQIDVVGATQTADLITAGGAVAATADQFGKLLVFQALINQPSGQIALTNADGTDNNNVKNLRQAFAAASASRTAINALANRLGGRGEQVLALSGTAVRSLTFSGNPFNFSNLLDEFDCQAAIVGHY